MPFDDKPSPGQPPEAEGGADEFARLFGQLAQPSPSVDMQHPAPVPKPSKAFEPPVRSAEPSPPGEFTQIFRQIARPTSKAPDLDTVSPLPAGSGPGEFTQIFSSTQAAATSAPPVPPASISPPSPRSSIAPGEPSPAKPVDPDSFTRIFGQPLGGNAPPTPPLRASPEKPSRAPAPLPFSMPAAPQRGGREPFAAFEEQRATPPLSSPAVGPDLSTNAVTQLFQMEEPRPAQPARVPGNGPTAVPSSPLPPPGGPGDFTRLMQELGASPRHTPSLAAHPPMPPAPAQSPGAPGEFTRLMQSLESSSAEELPPARTPAMQPMAPTPQPAGLHAGPGEFTRLMQSLNSQPAAPAANTAPQVASPAPLNAFVGESEFTRVMKGSSLRAGSSALPEVQVAAIQAPAPAANTAKDKMKAEVEPKSKKWLLILLLANLVLLLVLIVLAVLFLQHRH